MSSEETLPFATPTPPNTKTVLNNEATWKDLVRDIGNPPGAKRASEIWTPIDFRSKTFPPGKEDFELDIVVQRSLVLLSGDIRKGVIVAVVQRGPTDAQGERKTTGGSILFSGPADSSYQGILDKKVEHDHVEVKDGPPEAIGINVIKGRYLFLVRKVLIDPLRIKRGKFVDIQILWYPVQQALDILKDNKQMEHALLQVLMEDLQNASVI